MMGTRLGEDGTSPARITVVGVGGGGGNAVSRMIDAGLQGVKFVTINTDVQALWQNRALNKIQIGQALSDARFAWTVAEEVTRRLYEVIEAFAGNAFGSLRQRIARQLLDLAAEQQRDSRLIARVTQQELADATGTVREAAARALRQMRDDGLVDTTRRGILILDPTRLQREADVGTG